MENEYISAVCPHDCPSTCALEVERIDARTIGKVRGAKDNDYTAGVICAKVSNYRERVHHPDRLTHPLRRTGPKGSGQFERISWDAALDEVAAQFRAASERHGPTTVWPYYFAGTMGLVQRDGINRLRHVMGYSGQDSTICTSLCWNGWIAGTGGLWGSDPREMAKSDLIIVWGGNPVSTQVNVMTHISRARKQRGAKLVTIDPYRTPTAEASDLHLALKPGTDGALAVAMMHVLFKEGYADREYMEKYTDVPDQLEAHLKDKTPEWAAAITGLSVDQIVELARLYGKTKRSYIRVGYGFSRSRNGSANAHAVTCLPAVTGSWKYEGGGAMHSNSGMYKLNSTLIEGLDKRDASIRALDMCQLGDILLGEEASLLGGPPVTAMLVQNTNPALVAPDLAKVHQGLAREDLFLCVHEQFMTETAKFADIVLPATMFLEHDDMYKGGGHFYLQVSRKVIEPLGECRSNHQVNSELAKRLGAQHPGFEMSAWELIDATMQASNRGTAEQAVRDRWVDCSQSFEDAHFLNGFAHPDGKFRFAPKWEEIGSDHQIMPKLPDHMDNIENATDEHPFRMVVPPARRFLNSTFNRMPSSRAKEGLPSVLIHPEALADLGATNGECLRIGNHRGSIVIQAKSFDGMQKQVIIVEGIWPGADFKGGVGINVLIGSDRSPPAGGAAFHDTAVWIKVETANVGIIEKG